MVRIAILALAFTALAGCDGAKDDERERAAGQILPGTTSDAMLQTDRLQVEAPAADPTAAAKASEAKAPAGGRRAPAVAPSDAPPSPAPTEVPTPEAPVTPQASATPAP